MVEFINKNLRRPDPSYYYLVREFVTTFGADQGNNEPFTHEEKFEGRDLLKCRSDAREYYMIRLNGIENNKYFLPFAAPSDFEMGKNAAISITLALVEYYSEDNYFEHPLMGEDDRTTSESREIETAVLKEKGLM